MLSLAIIIKKALGGSKKRDRMVFYLRMKSEKYFSLFFFLASCYLLCEHTITAAPVLTFFPPSLFSPTFLLHFPQRTPKSLVNESKPPHALLFSFSSVFLVTS